MVRIALDAMGGDNAPIEAVAGAVEARRNGVDVVLVGRRNLLEQELERFQTDLPIVEAEDLIEMGEDAARAIRQKPQASVSVAARLVADGEVSGFVSAGSTGAALAASAVIVGRVRAVSRPSIASIFPTPVTPTLVLDSGANPDVKPEHLLQFGVMGAVAARALLGASNPRIGLLSNGEEEGKGRDLEKAAFSLLRDSHLNFVGNVEGRDVASDKVDVIVTDGFTGNIFLKTTEGAVQIVSQYIAEEIATLPSDIQSAVRPALSRVRDRLHYETYGGGHLLGVRGIVVIAHGSSSRVAFSNALRMARDGAEYQLPAKIESELSLI